MPMGDFFSVWRNSVPHLCFICTSMSDAILTVCPSAAICLTETTWNGILVGRFNLYCCPSNIHFWHCGPTRSISFIFSCLCFLEKIDDFWTKQSSTVQGSRALDPKPTDIHQGWVQEANTLCKGTTCSKSVFQFKLVKLIADKHILNWKSMYILRSIHKLKILLFFTWIQVFLVLSVLLEHYIYMYSHSKQRLTQQRE